MAPPLVTAAIEAALAYNWPEAVRINLELLKSYPKDIETLNRLAHAYKESGRIKLAQTTYKKVLNFDKFNLIANKNLKLLATFPQKIHRCAENHDTSGLGEKFLEEPGKTKTVIVVNPAPSSILLGLSYGHKVNLAIKRRTVVVTDLEGNYLGALPDDISARIFRYLKLGNRYEASVKTIAKNCLSVFIRETVRAARLKNQPTFPISIGNRSFSVAEESASEDSDEESSDDEVPSSES